MFLTQAILLSVSLVGVAKAAACAANNCARAVTGIRDKEPNQASRSADCASFLLATATPPPVTVTVTQTVRVTPTTTLSPRAQAMRAKRSDDQGGPLAARSVATVPAYASACSNTAQYASACSCFGVTASTTTLAPVTVTVAATATYGCTDPVVCGGGNVKHYPCPGTGFGNNQYCLCVLDTDGGSFCTPEGESCGELADCDSDADCASGVKCQVNTCCGVNKCTPDIAEACKDPSLAVFIN